MITNASRPMQIVFTNKAKCLDCNRCVRACPVKAIRIKDAQAQVDNDRCIICGTCVKECPQKAKTYRNDTEKVKELLETKRRVAVIIAPSYVAKFPDWKARRIPSLLRQLGFSFIVEASYTASMVSSAISQFAIENPSKSIIASACPAVINYIEKYKPEYISNLAPIISPMLATGILLKSTQGNDSSVVFVGPCTAKKHEAERKENVGIIDAVLTFEELEEWMTDLKIDLSQFEDSGFDLSPSPEERLFALSGGFYKAAGINTDAFSNEYIAISGFDEITETIKELDNDKNQRLIIEPLFCKYGCINGPGLCNEENLVKRKKNVIDYSANSEIIEKIEPVAINLSTKFSDDFVVRIPKFSEDEILKILEKTGKSNPEDQLDCTSCGYPSCRDKAIAVLCGMAEPEMCVPFIRKRTEIKADKIINQSPNGIVILNDKYEIQLMNDAFRKLFICSQSLIGKPISTLMDPDPFVKVATTDIDSYETTVRHEKYNLICQQIIYSLKDEKKTVGLFVNLTNTILNKTKLDELKKQTVNKATQLLEHQIEMAQKIAKLLGESTAQGEELVTNLMELTEDEHNELRSFKDFK